MQSGFTTCESWNSQYMMKIEPRIRTSALVHEYALDSIYTLTIKQEKSNVQLQLTVSSLQSFECGMEKPETNRGRFRSYMNTDRNAPELTSPHLVKPSNEKSDVAIAYELAEKELLDLPVTYTKAILSNAVADFFNLPNLPEPRITCGRTSTMVFELLSKLRKDFEYVAKAAFTFEILKCASLLDLSASSFSCFVYHSKEFLCNKETLKCYSTPRKFKLEETRLPYQNFKLTQGGSNLIERCSASTNMDDDADKFYRRRYLLFRNYDKGIKLDPESWSFVTADYIARHHAERCFSAISKDSLPGRFTEHRTFTAIDGFCGCGGNTIQLALKFDHVIAIDIDPIKIEYARHNAKLFGVEHKINFICGNFFQVVPNHQADVVFMSPPWGGSSYGKGVFNIEYFGNINSEKMMKTAFAAAANAVLFLPRNSNIKQVISLATLYPASSVHLEIERNSLNWRYNRTLTAYFGHDICRNYRNEEFYLNTQNCRKGGW